MKALFGIVAVVLVLYASVVALVFVFQRSMLYFPDRRAPDPIELAARGLQLWPDAEASSNSLDAAREHQRAEADFARGVVAADPPQPAKGTVVVWHGNAGAAWQRGYYFDALEPLGYRVLLAEYPGYGGRPGAPSEETIVADALETMRLAYAEFGAPLVLWGESLGAGVAASLAAAIAAEAEAGTARAIPIAGVVLVTPWDTLPTLARRLYPFLPTGLLLRDRYNSVGNVSRVSRTGVPVAIVIAEQDEVIPAAHAHRLYDSVPGAKRRWVLPDATHNSWAVPPDARWWAEVMRFVGGAAEN